MWLCYLLMSNNSRKTYVGATINLINRLHKHNTCKGAKYTRGENWSVACYVTGFHTKQQCLSFEKNWQRLCRRRKKCSSPLIGRLTDLFVLVNKQWSRYVCVPSLVPLQINWIIEDRLNQTVPEYIKVAYEFEEFAEPC